MLYLSLVILFEQENSERIGATLDFSISAFNKIRAPTPPGEPAIDPATRSWDTTRLGTRVRRKEKQAIEEHFRRSGEMQKGVLMMRYFAHQLEIGG